MTSEPVYGIIDKAREKKRKNKMSIEIFNSDGYVLFRSDKDRLRGEDFSDMLLNGADFSPHSLLDADFSGAVLSGANFAGCDLSGSIFINATIQDVDFSDARIGGRLVNEQMLADCNADLLDGNIYTPKPVKKKAKKSPCCSDGNCRKETSSASIKELEERVRSLEAKVSYLQNENSMRHGKC